MTEIPNEKLTIFHVPAKWDDWNQFALTFNGYEALGHEQCARLANQKSPKTLTEYRACLFFEARRWRHFGQPPDEEAHAYIQSLLEGIRDILIAKTQPESTER